ncbi:hypothetical protein ACFPA8_05480 [Streptomyces ovatisporus]|uniref:Integral membrane protein n=1 Tax=Streptomyces ovatisporus TaxID=1128682 RepID=A0ABV9A1N5_9ACTN
MSVRRPPSPGTAEPDRPAAACPYEPGDPVGGEAWDVRSWALLASSDVSADVPDSAARVPAARAKPSDGSDAASSRSMGASPGSRVPGPREARPTARAVTGPADPVRELMHRHRGLCERAVDPLEIAAGLEAVGVTDRTAARFRHRDVFSLAEELFARVPRADGERDVLSSRSDAGPSHSSGGSRNRSRASHCAGGRIARWMLNAFLVLLPAMLTGVCVALSESALVRQADGPAVAAGVATAAFAVGLSVRFVLCRLAGAKAGLPTLLSAGWLTGVVVCTDRLQGGQDGSAGEGAAGAVSAATVPLALACALVPAVLCARRFAVGARRRLAGSRTLDDFAAGMWPLLTATVALFALLMPGLQVVFAQAAGIVVGPGERGGGDAGGSGAGSSSVSAEVLMSTTALGMLLFTALLLTAHGFRRAASTGLGVACGVETVVLTVGAVPAGGSAPGPLRPELVPAAVCACVALGLLAWAYRLLGGAFAHHGGGRESRSVRSAPRHCADCARPGDGVHRSDEGHRSHDVHSSHDVRCPHDEHSSHDVHSSRDVHSSPDEHGCCAEPDAHSETPWGATP